MKLPTTLQGRPFGPEQLREIQALIAEQDGWSRYRLSRELAARWIGEALRVSSKTWRRERSCSTAGARVD